MHRKKQKINAWICKAMTAVIVVLTVTVGIVPLQSHTVQAGQKRIVKVGYYTSPNFQEYDENTDEYSGSGYDYLIALQQYTNWEYEFVKVPFLKGLEMLESGEIDLMNNVSKTEEREKTLLFSQFPSGENHGSLVVPEDDTEHAYNDYKSFESLTIGVVKKSIFKKPFEDYCKRYNIAPMIVEYNDEKLMKDGLEAGTIDARIVSSSYNDGSRVVAKFEPIDYYFATSIENEDLLLELNDGMTDIELDMPNFKNQLEEKYGLRTMIDKPVLSIDEKAFLESNNQVTVAVSGAWYPLFYYDEKGEMTGTLSEIYKRVAKATGIEFKAVKYENYDKALEAVKNAEVDLIVEFPYDFLYANEWNVQLSDLINGIETYCIMDKDHSSDDIKVIACHGEPYMESQLHKKYGDKILYKTFDTVDEAVQAVMDGTADCTFVNYYTSTKFQNQGKYISLKYIIVPSLKYNFGMGISRAADPCLKSILGKGLSTIDNDTMEALFEDSTYIIATPDIEAQFYQNPMLFFIIVGSASAIIVLVLSFIFYSRRMRRKNVELRHANDAKSKFLSRVSHDMRTPMNVILGTTMLIKDEQMSDRTKDGVQQIQMSGRYLLNLINDTLDVNRIEADQLELHMTATNANKLTDNIINNAKLLADEKGVDLEVEKITPEKITPTILAIDEARVEQMFMNLISNAVKFTPIGGKVFLTIERLETTDERILNRYQIIDTGIGMSPEFVNHIFEPYTQEGRADTDRESGSGLGMAIVKKLAELMEASIEIDSEKDRGTKFTITIPFKLFNGDVEEEDTYRYNENALKGKRVLICEDHPLNAQIAQTLLEQKEMLVEVAENGLIGVNKFLEAEDSYYDLVLMDIRMPVMDGLEATKKIRKIKKKDAKTIPIVAMTANAFEEDIDSCLEAGMNAHLSKPIKPGLMYATIAQYIGE